MYTYIHSFLDSFTIYFITEYRVDFPVLYSKSIVTYFICSSVYKSSPTLRGPQQSLFGYDFAVWVTQQGAHLFPHMLSAGAEIHIQDGTLQWLAS